LSLVDPGHVQIKSIHTTEGVRGRTCYSPSTMKTNIKNMTGFALTHAAVIVVFMMVGAMAPGCVSGQAHESGPETTARPNMHSENMESKDVAMTDSRSEDVDLGAVVEAHMEHEFVDRDVDATMLTMTDDPYVFNVPMLTGGFGAESVRRFYTKEFVGKMPADVKVTPISRTVGKDRVVDELVLSFTHDVQLDFMLPGVPPTGKYVELPYVVVMKFENGKIAHEHIYWDQASLLVQVGLLDPTLVPAVGADQAHRLVELADWAR